MKFSIGWPILRVVCPIVLVGVPLLAIPGHGQTRAYVTNTSGTVSVINTMTNTIVATISVGIFPSGVAITPDGTRAYVANIVNSISVIDTATNAVVDDIFWAISYTVSDLSR